MIWRPKYDVNRLIAEMVDADIDLFERDMHLKKGGYRVLNYLE